ncbi:hypothetical protein BkAM31D_13435 [Halalkalibacter krulwichiae]|uniref:Uncharacterized protein n=1 Tax=Halalkalibacter krulwichiae TaxID=199441 RepID=A0A1X9MDP1_9BACI|nr:hypothetical protein BkAM31D_13435 [Halalkalibacter krulwichiae]
MDYKNRIAKILFLIGIGEMVAGLILAFVFGTVDVGYYTTRYEVSWGYFF